MQNLFCVTSLAVASVIFPPMLLRLNNHEVHKFIILLRESSFWYFLLYALRTHSHYWLHFSPTHFLLMECVDCVSPSLSKLLLFRWFLPVFFDITAFVFHDIVVSLIPSVRFGASFCRNLGDGGRVIPKCVICVSTAGELFCRRVWFLHPVVLVFQVVHTLITLCPSRGRTKTIKWPFFSSHWWL